MCWVRGNDGLAKGETEGTGEKGPINILSWLPGSITAVEKLTSHKAEKFTSELFNSHWKKMEGEVYCTPSLSHKKK